MFTYLNDVEFEKWVESGLSTFETQCLVAEIYFNQNLTPGKIKEYMKFLKSKYGADTCRTTFNYIIMVLGKYLLMTVSWSIHKGNLDGVEEEFSKFNENFYQLVQDFSIVTGEEFVSGFEDEQEQSNSLKGIDNYSGEVQKLATQLQQGYYKSRPSVLLLELENCKSILL